MEGTYRHRPALSVGPGRLEQRDAREEGLHHRGLGEAGRYMDEQALDRGYEVVGVCREKSVAKLDPFKGRITVIPGATDDREVIERAVEGCGGVLVVLVPRGVHGYSTGTTQAVLDYAPPGARLVFSCGWHITATAKTSTHSSSRRS